jgi:3-hydroxy acid dehydrogenase / malonic semialdehyde reductase
MRTEATLKDEIVFITGASSGIGLATAEALIAREAKVVAAARRRDRLEALTKALGENCLAFELDVNDPIGVPTILERLPKRFKDITVLVNNAGIDTSGHTRFDQGKIDEWISTIETNVLGVMRVSHAIIPAMLAQGRGHIVNLGSISGIQPYAGGSIYTTSKFAIHGLSKSLRLDYLEKNIRVTEVMPGVTRTEFDLVRKRGDREKSEAWLGKWPKTLNAEDIAGAIVYALEQPSHVTVSELLILPSA